MDIDRPYLLFLGDLRSSVTLPITKRQRMISALEQGLHGINETHQNNLQIPLSISYGDEIAGLFKTTHGMIDVIFKIEDILFEITGFRFTIVNGWVGSPSEDIRKIGGSIFKKANQLIDQLKKNNRYGIIDVESQPECNLMTSLFNLRSVWLNAMTPYQQSIWKLRKTGLSQVAISRKLGKKPQSVSNAAISASIDLIIEVESSLRQSQFNTQFENQ